MQKLIDHILEHCHPGQLSYTRVDASQLMRDVGIEKEALDPQWPQIELALKENNLIMIPALPDADEGEAVRVFRCDAPLTRVLIEVLYPTEKGDALLVETMRAITQKGNRPPQRPRPNRPQRNDRRPRHGQAPRQGRPPQSEGSAPRHSHIPNPMETGSNAHFVRPLE